MCRVSRLWVTACLVIAITLMVVVVGASQIPRKVNYQGRLTDSVTGRPMPGYHTMTFRLYDSVGGGTLLWSEAQPATADSAGVFSVLLGDSNPMGITFGGPVWLEVEVDGETLSPRREIVSVPFAFRALSADSLGGHTPEDFVLAGHTSSITGEMITDGEISDTDIATDAGIDPAKIAGTAWTSTNDGGGSGLDADMVDGRHADAFSDTGHIHDERYYRQEELSGDGTINLPGNPVDWTKLKGVPGGLADGIDNEGTGDGHSLDAVDGDPVDAVYVDVDGNVGVGTTEPALGKLTVLASSGTGVYASSPNGISVFGHSPDGTGVSGSSTSGLAGAFMGDVYVSDALGVGTASPAAELDVVGDISVTSKYMIVGRPVLYVPGDNGLAVGMDACGGHVVSGVTAVGDSAGYSCTYRGNTFVGQAAGRSTTTGHGNVFLGDHAGYANAIGWQNTFLGQQAGLSNINGCQNTFVGWGAGATNTFGSLNTFIGVGSGGWNSEGWYNTFVGCGAGQFNQTGTNNVFLGHEAGSFNGTGNNNTFVGNGAGRGNQTGRNNTFVGLGAGSGCEAGSLNVFLGSAAGRWEKGSRKLYIANGGDLEDVLIYGDFATGRIGLGTLDPERKLHIVGDNPRILIEAESVSPEINFKNTGDASTDIWSIYKHGTADDLRFYQGGDKVTIQGGTGNVGIGTANPGTYRLYVSGDACGTGTWGACSDLKFKRDVKDIENPLGKVIRLRGVAFAWRTGEYPEKGFDKGSHYGVIAQEVETVLPEVVREGIEGEKSVAYSEIIPVLIESIKQLKAENEELTQRLAAVEARLD